MVMKMNEAAVSAKSVSKFIFLVLSILSFIFTLVLFVQVHHLHQLLNQQQDQFNTQISHLQSNSTEINNSLKDLESAQMSLKQMQAVSANLAAIELEHNVLQGQNKTILLNGFNSVVALSAPIHASSVNVAINQLQQAINNLPSLNPANALASLSTLQASLASLSFVNSIPEPTPINPTVNNTHGFTYALHKIWQELKSLVIVRSDNAIGAQLVSAAARFDAVRQLNLLIQEAQWQILTMQDPSNTLTQLKINIAAYTQNDQNQAAWLNQLNQLTTAANYYTQAQIQPVLTAINNLQQALSLQ